MSLPCASRRCFLHVASSGACTLAIDNCSSYAVSPTSCVAAFYKVALPSEPRTQGQTSCMHIFNKYISFFSIHLVSNLAGMIGKSCTRRAFVELQSKTVCKVRELVNFPFPFAISPLRASSLLLRGSAWAAVLLRTPLT